MTRKINDAGLDLIKTFEGLRLLCYDDGVGVATIGYGHTRSVSRSDIGHRRITKEKAEKLLQDDVSTSERAVEQYISVALNDNQFAALVSFTFNLGAGSLKQSTLRRKLNTGDYDAVPSELARWVRAGGQTLNGLVKRRRAEGELFTTPVSRVGEDTDNIMPHRLDVPDGPIIRGYLSDQSIALERGSVDDQGSANYAHLNQNAPDGYVVELQTDLLALGFGGINVDGAFGNKTRKAVMEFERKAKIFVDGIVDRSTTDNIALWLKEGHTKTDPPGVNNDDLRLLTDGTKMIAPRVPHFSQGDARWGQRVLGRSSSISKQGCAITSIAMIQKFYGRDVEPGSLDVYLDNHDGYHGNSVIWSVAGKFKETRTKKLKYFRKSGRESDLIKIIKQRVDNNLPTMARVDYGIDGDLTYNHFVVCVGVTEEGDIIMNDPATRSGDGYQNPADDNIIQQTSRKSGYRIVQLDFYDPAV